MTLELLTSSIAQLQLRENELVSVLAKIENSNIPTPSKKVRCIGISKVLNDTRGELANLISNRNGLIKLQGSDNANQ